MLVSLRVAFFFNTTETTNR